MSKVTTRKSREKLKVEVHIINSEVQTKAESIAKILAPMLKERLERREEEERRKLWVET